MKRFNINILRHNNEIFELVNLLPDKELDAVLSMVNINRRDIIGASFDKEDKISIILSESDKKLKEVFK